MKQSAWMALAIRERDIRIAAFALQEEEALRSARDQFPDYTVEAFNIGAWRIKKLMARVSLWLAENGLAGSEITNAGKSIVRAVGNALNSQT